MNIENILNFSTFIVSCSATTDKTSASAAIKTAMNAATDIVPASFPPVMRIRLCQSESRADADGATL
ncbi:hypothetical protein RQCS_58290 (plasmid) [Rhodococcus qingshengii]|nr:hypothetical protein RQCS_58290 [Rhodococcus qingshengii]